MFFSRVSATTMQGESQAPAPACTQEDTQGELQPPSRTAHSVQHAQLSQPSATLRNLPAIATQHTIQPAPTSQLGAPVHQPAADAAPKPKSKQTLRRPRAPGSKPPPPNQPDDEDKDADVECERQLREFIKRTEQQNRELAFMRRQLLALACERAIALEGADPFSRDS